MIKWYKCKEKNLNVINTHLNPLISSLKNLLVRYDLIPSNSLVFCSGCTGRIVKKLLNSEKSRVLYSN